MGGHQWLVFEGAVVRLRAQIILETRTNGWGLCDYADLFASVCLRVIILSPLLIMECCYQEPICQWWQVGIRGMT
jgi:hypothetical protein